MPALSISATPINQLYDALQSSPDGLTAALAEERLKRKRKDSQAESIFRKRIKLLFRQFQSPLILLLVIAALLSFIVGESSDSFIILFILLSTALLGFWQEMNAGKAMERLRKLIETNHTVIRGGVQVKVISRDIVAGDLILLDAGDLIPADCRILKSNELHVNESALTGESFPVEKMEGEADELLPLGRKYNCLWKGTNVITGTASVIAVYTGKETIFGQMAGSLQQNPETAFEKGIRKFGYFLLRITIILSISILVINLYFKKPLFDSVLFSLALAVGMAPELLPAIMTFAMAGGAKRMSKKKVVVKKLSSIFNFGEVNILCTDKTGTITEGNAMVKGTVDGKGATSEKVRLFAYLNATCQNGFTNPVDQAIGELQVTATGYIKTDEIPYDFIRKRLSVAVKKDDHYFLITKGAFSNVFDVCTQIEYADGSVQLPGDEDRNVIRNLFISYCEQGYRVLGMAYKKLDGERIHREYEQGLIFLGFVLLEDPLKDSALSSIERLRSLYVNVKIITGDNRYAALYTARKLGLPEPVIITGGELKSISPEALVIKAIATDIFAEIEPQQKEYIIKALQKSGNTIAYVGDGINDVAAINTADIGISTSNAVDVAREAADFVLLEKDLAVLADGIAEGRRSFSNSMKYVLITTGATFGNMLSVAGASLILPFLPMLPKQILLTNFITDFPFLAIASDEVDKQQLVKPGKWNLSMIRRFMIVFGLHSSVFDFITFYVLYYHFRLSGSGFQTGWFLESAITELVILFIVRTRQPFFKSSPGRLLIITGIIAFLATVYLPFSPFAAALGLTKIHGQQVIAISLILLAYIFTADIIKILFFRQVEKRRRSKEEAHASLHRRLFSRQTD